MLGRVLLLLAAAAADTADGGVADPSAQCIVCELLTASLATALTSTKAELDGYRDAKEVAIGRVQKAQTKRWLKQEYGSTLYAGVEGGATTTTLLLLDGSGAVPGGEAQSSTNTVSTGAGPSPHDRSSVAAAPATGSIWLP
jgi:hypothetical protein